MCCEDCKKNNNYINNPQIEEIIKKYDNNPSGLISCLQEIQDLLLYVPQEIVPVLSKRLGTPESDISSVLTFYTQFNLKPKAKYTIEVCLGTACYVQGAEAILNKFQQKLGIGVGEITADHKYEIAQSRCFGCCSLAPVVAINGEVVGNVTTADVEKILEKYN